MPEICEPAPPVKMPDLFELADGAATVRLDDTARRRIFKQTAIAVCTEETRYYLNGVFLAVEAGRLVAVATDGHRLVRVDTGLVPDREWPSIIVPRAAVKVFDLVRPWELSTDGKVIRALAPDGCYTTGRIDGSFPDVTRVIPAPTDNTIAVTRKVLLAALDKLKAATPKNGCVRLAWSPLGLVLSLRDGPASGLIGVATEGEGNVAVSLNYLAGMVKNIDGKTVRFDVSDPYSPFRITDPADPALLQVCMPMRW